MSKVCIRWITSRWPEDFFEDQHVADMQVQYTYRLGQHSHLAENTLWISTTACIANGVRGQDLIQQCRLCRAFSQTALQVTPGVKMHVAMGRAKLIFGCGVGYQWLEHFIPIGWHTFQINCFDHPAAGSLDAWEAGNKVEITRGDRVQISLGAHGDPGTRIIPLMHAVIHQPRVAPHGYTAASSFEVGFRRYCILVIA